MPPRPSRRLVLWSVGAVGAAIGFGAWRRGSCGPRAPAGPAPRGSSARPVPAFPSGRTPTPTGDALALADALRRRYPEGGGEGYALVGDDAVLRYVHVLAAGDHWVYVTSRHSRAATPHELVMRVFGDAHVGTPGAWRSAPTWPVRVLTEIAHVEVRTGRDFGHRDDLTNVRLSEDPQPPYRHFSFMAPDGDIPDPVGSAGRIRLVRVVPLTDDQKNEIYATGKLGPLAAWYERDPLLRVR